MGFYEPDIFVDLSQLMQTFINQMCHSLIRNILVNFYGTIIIIIIIHHYWYEIKANIERKM